MDHACIICISKNIKASLGANLPNPQVAPVHLRQWRLPSPALDQRQPVHELTTQYPHWQMHKIAARGVLTGYAPPGARTMCRPGALEEAPPPPLNPLPTATKNQLGTETALALTAAAERPVVWTTRVQLHSRFLSVSRAKTTNPTVRYRAAARNWCRRSCYCSYLVPGRRAVAEMPLAAAAALVAVVRSGQCRPPLLAGRGAGGPPPWA